MQKIAWDSPNINQDHDLRGIWGEFIHESGPWNWWATFTFQGPVTPSRALDVFREYARELAQKVVRAHLNLAWVLDGNGGHWHFHALLGLPGGFSVTARELESTWTGIAPGLSGFTHIRKYDESKGAASYLGQKSDQYGVSLDVVCPRRPQCRRGKGCMKSRHAW